MSGYGYPDPADEAESLRRELFLADERTRKVELELAGMSESIKEARERAEAVGVTGSVPMLITKLIERAEKAEALVRVVAEAVQSSTSKAAMTESLTDYKRYMDLDLIITSVREKLK